jgi:hypothetical protein
MGFLSVSVSVVRGTEVENGLPDIEAEGVRRA